MFYCVNYIRKIIILSIIFFLLVESSKASDTLDDNLKAVFNPNLNSSVPKSERSFGVTEIHTYNKIFTKLENTLPIKVLQANQITGE